MIVTQYIWQTPDEQVGGLKALDYLYDRNKPIDLNETGYYPLASWYDGRQDRRRACGGVGVHGGRRLKFQQSECRVHR